MAAVAIGIGMDIDTGTAIGEVDITERLSDDAACVLACIFVDISRHTKVPNGGILDDAEKGAYIAATSVIDVVDVDCTPIAFEISLEATVLASAHLFGGGCL